MTGILGVGIGNVSNTFSLGQNASWTNYSPVFTPSTTGFYVLSFGNIGMLLDNVTVTGVSPIPEPETYAMLLAGLARLGAAGS